MQLNNLVTFAIENRLLSKSFCGEPLRKDLIHFKDWLMIRNRNNTFLVDFMKCAHGYSRLCYSKSERSNSSRYSVHRNTRSVWKRWQWFDYPIDVVTRSVASIVTSKPCKYPLYIFRKPYKPCPTMSSFTHGFTSVTVPSQPIRIILTEHAW